ncbi:hypothetical protein [Intrasporangium sp.]|uniref:hypothetical protein n=1 Tax=Intrasporangium sp. TaxID=1925024 RepID=UPI002939698C|nr:hypothetical protein [Intrasporangium sp.]MDV3223024.1 hypothetical protein [Intrasporangium sp.]
MSQATATARPLRAPARSPRRATPPPLRVIPARITSTGNGAFASICVVLLVTGLVALLLLNTALAQGSLELGRLQRESAVLAETAGNLQEEIDRASASGALAKKASQLGMVRSNERGHIDLKSGKVTGTAYPAGPAQAFTVVTSPTPVAKPKPKPKATPKAEPKPTQAQKPASATPTAPGATPAASPTATLGAATPTETPSTPAPPTQPTPTR